MLNLRAEFESTVIEPFIDAYAKGRTPNPCILCNRHIKFPFLLKIAEENGFDAIATGHYARVEDGALLKGVDARKDQSYVLYVLRRGELDRLVLPLGGLRKTKVRELAGKLDLSSRDRPESQEICFVEENKYYRLMEELASTGEGPIVDIESGRVLGNHSGIYRYTIGQRKRLGVATGRPLYVVKIDPAQGAVYVGPKELVMMKEFPVEDINWLTPSIPPLSLEFRASVKVRSTMRDEPAMVTLLGSGRAKVVYDEPQWAPAPGQSAVFYDGDTVIGGGVIV